ncbi:MAG: GNAT family N-acetyltransferase [Niabella sp.]
MPFNTLPDDFYENNYLFSYDKSKIQIAVVYKYLSEESYWAQRIPLAIVERSIQNAICLGIYDSQGAQIGFGRMITDQAVFAYLADVFILKPHRGKGLSKTMVRAFCSLAESFEVRRLMLATQDAHGLYAQYGFEPLSHPERIMNKKGITY